jgi:dethiobiotin synthase
MSKGIYIAATNQHIGKTTTTLGLIAVLMAKGINVGYCKPMGQRYVYRDGMKIDKDAALFADMMGFTLNDKWHSPVIMDGGDSVRYLNKPEPKAIFDKLDYAAYHLHQQHDIVVYEGTGHPGVGSVFDFSNADVAKRLNLPVILVVKGGIGNTIDQLNVCRQFFEQIGVPIAGVIVNKVMVKKMDKVQRALQQYFDRNKLELLGLIPFAEELAYPMLSTIKKIIEADVLNGFDQLHNLVEDIIAGSLVDKDELNMNKKYLLVVSARRLTAALSKLRQLWTISNSLPNLTGVVLTGDALISQENLGFLRRHNIPTLHTHYDTYESVIKISQLNVKINAQAPQKIKRATELFEKHVNIKRITEIIMQNNRTK